MKLLSLRLVGASIITATLAIASPWVSAQEAAQPDKGAPVTNDQIFMMMFADQGRSVGFQSMLIAIHLETLKAQVDRDAAILARNLELFERSAISELELEISQLKDAWNRLQLVVAEKNLTTVAAQVAALQLIGDHFAGKSVPLDDLYSAYLEGWNAGCDKGPAEVRANEAWMAYAEKALQRARELNSRGNLSDATLLQREVDLRIARSNYENRASRLDRCRQVFFPSLEEVARQGQ
ncbi:MULTISPECIES: hypothetical protein [unclassified Ruegeria]|uniref:hypothetical protein n=1 Tax=unclassified Ruegeria TaxID=2625375 RepID=UPI0014881E87|nr:MULTISPECIES: hypothetical protein [unclassified Ruegeria]NOD65897.1 hypothetical protein [Ruegeria sp. HKCCD6109]